MVNDGEAAVVRGGGRRYDAILLDCTRKK